MSLSGIFSLIVKTNETKVKIDDVQCLALKDSKAQLSTITISFAQE